MISKYILALEISEVRFDVWQWCILVVCNIMLLRAWNCLYAMGQKILESGVFFVWLRQLFVLYLCHGFPRRWLVHCNYLQLYVRRLFLNVGMTVHRVVLDVV